MTRLLHPSRLSAAYRVLAGVVVGVLIALLMPNVEPWTARILCGWIAFTVTLALLIAPLWRADADLTARFATRDDDTRAFARVFALLTATVSLLGPGIVLHEASARSGAMTSALIIPAPATVAVSWLVLHLEYTLHYAHR